MAADLHIHVFAEGDMTDEDFKCFFGNTLGSKWFRRPVCMECMRELTLEDMPKIRENDFDKPQCPGCGAIDQFGFNRSPCDSKFDCEHWRKISDSPNIWVGSVSWLKAALTGSDEFVPDPVGAVAERIGEDLPVIDETLIEDIETALARENTTSYETEDEESDVVAFLRKHMGKRAFTVSW